jgi:hypothetical protein
VASRRLLFYRTRVLLGGLIENNPSVSPYGWVLSR